MGKIILTSKFAGAPLLMKPPYKEMYDTGWYVLV